MRPSRPIITSENIAAAKLLEFLLLRCRYFRTPIVLRLQTVTGGTTVLGSSVEQLVQYLQRNEIVAGPMRVELDGRSTGEATVLARAP